MSKSGEWIYRFSSAELLLFSSSVCSREFINMCSEQTYRTFKCLDKEGEKLELLMMEEVPCLNINNESQQEWIRSSVPVAPFIYFSTSVDGRFQEQWASGSCRVGDGTRRYIAPRRT